MCVWILTVWIQLQFVFFVFSTQDIDKGIINRHVGSSNSQVLNQNYDKDKEHKQDNIKNTSMINMDSEHNTTTQMKAIADVRDSLKSEDRDVKINGVMNKVTDINNNGSANNYKNNTAITTKSKQDVIERRQQALDDFLSKTSKEDTRDSLLQLRRAFDPPPNYNDMENIDNNDDIDPDLLEMDLDKDYTIPTYPPARYALNRSFFYDQNYPKESIGKKLWQKVNVGDDDNKKLVPEPEVTIDDNKTSNKKNTSNTINPREGIKKVLRSGNNNMMFDNIGNENMDISAGLESSSYVYPKEYVFEVLQSPGIPEAVNFRTRTTEIIEGEPYFMSTLPNMLDTIDPEIFNMDKKPIQDSAPKQKQLVPDPRKVTYPTITTTRRNLDYDFFENGAFSLGPTQSNFNNFQTYPNRDLTTSDKISDGAYDFEPVNNFTARKLIAVSPSTTTTSTTQGFFSVEPVYKTKTRKRPAVMTSSTQATKKLFNNTTKPFTTTTASATIKSTKPNLPYEHKLPSVANTSTVSVPATVLIQKKETAPTTNKKYSKADNPTITIWSVTVITNTMNPKGHWWTPSLNTTADPFVVNYDVLPEQESTTTSTAQPTKFSYYQTTTRAGNMASKRHFEPYTKPGITRKPSPLKKKWEEERKQMVGGHFTFFVYKFMREIAVKEPPNAAKELADEFLPAINEWYTARPTLRKLGEPFTMGLIQFFTNIQNETPESLKVMASTFSKALKMRHNVFTIEFNYLFDAMDKMYTPEEKDKMLDVLEDVKNYPDIPQNSRQIIKSLIDEAFVKPFHRLGPTKRRHQFVESLNIYLSYTYYDGKHIFIPENAIRRKMENDAEVRNRKAFDLERKNKMNENLFVRTLRKQLANSTNENGENYSDASQNTVEDPVEELNENIHNKRVTEHLKQLRNGGLQFNYFAGNKLRAKSSVTRKEKQSKIFAIGPNPHFDYSKTFKKYLKKNPEKYDSLSIENSEYLKSITIFEPEDKLSILRNDKKSKHFKKNITRHKDKLSALHKNKNIKYFNKNIPKEKDYTISLSSDEESKPPKEVVNTIKKFGDLIFHSHKNKKVNKKVSPNPVKMIKHNNLKTKPKQSTFQPPKKVKSEYYTSKNSQKIGKNKKSVRKKPIHGKRYTMKTAYKKMSPKEIKSWGNETRKTKRIKLISIKTKKNRSKMIERQANYKEAKLGSKFSTTRHETHKKKYYKFKEHIKLKFRDHKIKSNKTEMRASNLTVNLTSLTNLQNIKSQYLTNDVPSKMSRLTTRDVSYYYWHPPENYDDVSLSSETQEHFAAARDKQVNEEFKDYANTILSAENKHDGVFKSTRLDTHTKVKTNTGKPTILSMPTTLGVPKTSTQSTLSIPTMLGMLRTPSKIIKQFQVEIMQTKVPDKDVLRKIDKTLNKYIADQDLASYKYLHKNEDVIYSFLRSKPPPVWIPNDKTRFNKNTFHDRKLEVFNVNDNTESSGSSSECDGRSKTDRNVRKDKILEKIKFESSYSDYETNLRVSLNDAFIHGLDEGLYRRMMNADIDKEHEELNSKLLLPTSESDEEMLLKSNIYKSLRNENKNNTQVTNKI